MSQKRRDGEDRRLFEDCRLLEAQAQHELQIARAGGDRTDGVRARIGLIHTRSAAKVASAGNAQTLMIKHVCSIRAEFNLDTFPRQSEGFGSRHVEYVHA